MQKGFREDEGDRERERESERERERQRWRERGRNRQAPIRSTTLGRSATSAVRDTRESVFAAAMMKHQ